MTKDRMTQELMDIMVERAGTNPVKRANLWEYAKSLKMAVDPWTPRDLADMTKMEPELKEWWIDLAQREERGDRSATIKLGLSNRSSFGKKTVRSVQRVEKLMQEKVQGLPDKYLTDPYKKPKDKSDEKAPGKKRGPKRPKTEEGSGGVDSISSASPSKAKKMIFDRRLAPDTTAEAKIEISPMGALQVGGSCSSTATTQSIPWF